jgi:molecular chaperone HtpG
VVNGGYTYHSEIVDRLPALDPGIRVARLDPGELVTLFEMIDPATELAARPFLAAAQRALDPLDCDVTLRAFDPPSVPALYLVDRELRQRAELRAARKKADELWSGVLGAFDDGTGSDRPQLVLNHRSPLLRRITELPDPRLGVMAVEALYTQALLLGQHPLRPADSALLNRSFAGLLEWAVHDQGDLGVIS